jgi:hypothetical protein
MNNQTVPILVVGLIIGLLLGGFGGYLVSVKKQTTPTVANIFTTPSASPLPAQTFSKQLALYQDMRRLWADHVIWTRAYIIGAVDGTADVKEATNRLLKNQEDLGNAVVPYYGAEAGKKLTELLKQHILIAVDLVDAAKKKDTTTFNDANNRWKQNANDIAVFLSQANPNWPKDSLIQAMNMHLATTITEAQARLNKDYAADVQAFDAVFHHILVMSDTFTAGIIKQFPEKF